MYMFIIKAQKAFQPCLGELFQLRVTVLIQHEAGFPAALFLSGGAALPVMTTALTTSTPHTQNNSLMFGQICHITLH